MPLTALLALLLLAALSTAGWLIAAPEIGVHPAKTPCQNCHLAAKLESLDKPDQAHLLIASQEALCQNCHPKATQVSHPSGFAPKNRPPADYPLDWKGDLTCSTCHDIHGKTPGLLRGKRRGRELCLTCHEATFFSRMKDQGNSVTASGHLDAGGGAPALKLDSYSRQCMDCHGNKGDNPTSIDRNSIVRHGVSSTNHPIGANYADAVKFGGYRPARQLSKRILLPGGLVSCVSCHEGYSKQHGKLVTPKLGSTLCYECHDI